MSHTPILETRCLRWADEAACEAFAAQLSARILSAKNCAHPTLRDACIELDGPLGAGKTTFVRHLLRALGVSGRIKSPTYAVVEPYELDCADAPGGRWLISHFDFYRFSDPREWEDAGFRETFANSGLKLCEWAVNAGPLRPQADLRLSLQPQDDDSRLIVAEIYSPLGRELLP